MANKALKGLTIKIGGDTSELLKSLKDVEKQGSDLSKELGDINKLLKLDPSNTELLAQKQKVLASAVSNTEKKLDTLREAEKQAQEQFKEGKISEAQYRALQREIIATEKKLDGYKNAVEETTRELKDLADSVDNAAEELDDQADKSRDAEDAAEDLDDSTSDLAKGGLAAMAAAATAAVASIVALAESSREYRNEMAKLDTAFQSAGFSAAAATKTYEALQGVVGETEQAVEAANHLAKLVSTEEELVEWTEILTGVYATWGSSLSIESLTEAANETSRVGALTGSLADSLNWAAAEGETFGVTMKAATAENEEWNKAVEEAASAEDYFNLALQECTTQQERQQLITKTLTKLYSGAAAQFKKSNKEVIRSNEATEKWNKATAELGASFEPVMTDVKELGVTLLEDFEEPLESVTDFIREDVIPAIKSTSKWVKENGPVIKATIVGVAAATVAYKVAVLATRVAQVGLTAAIKATTVAQTALNLAQKASPWGLVAAGVSAAVVGFFSYLKSLTKTVEKVDVLTKEERELAEAADEAAEAFREQTKATEDNLAKVTAEMDYVESLAEELKGLADASGKVKKADQARADFILGQLNEALGTEYKRTGDIIENYKEMEKSIKDMMQTKKAELLLDAYNDQYVQAIQGQSEALANATLKEKEYEAALKDLNSVQEANAKDIEYYQAEMKKGYVDDRTRYSYEQNIKKLREEIDAAQANVNAKKEAWDQSAADYEAHTETVITFTEAQTAALEGNYETAVDLLSRKKKVQLEFSDTVDQETKNVVNALYKEAIDAGIKAKLFKENFENGVSGFTAEHVAEAEKAAEDAMDAFSDAYADAEGVGEDLGDGLTEGLENTRPSLLTKARSLVSGFLSAARKAGDTHSPSHKTEEIGEDMGEGAVIGVENKTKDLKRAATDQAGVILDAYRSEETNAQKALRHVADLQTARQVNAQMAAASSSSPILEKILTAIEKGQILTIDGDALVGATANSMDSALGRRRDLAARGAI